MNTKLTQRGAEIAQQFLIYLASFDCMTLKQGVLLVYGIVNAAGTASMQRKLKQMAEAGLIGRKQARDGLYRYYLLEAGVRAANENLLFVATSGSDRSYLNCARRDAVINALIADMHSTPNSRAVGAGALRRSAGGKYREFDGALVVSDENGTRFVKLYAQIGSPSAANVARYDRLKAAAKSLKVPLIVIAENFTKKVLGLKT